MGKDVERELGEAGVPPEMSSRLAELAQEIEAQPPVKPRRTWKIQTKKRLLRRFDEQHRDTDGGGKDS